MNYWHKIISILLIFLAIFLISKIFFSSIKTGDFILILGSGLGIVVGMSLNLFILYQLIKTSQRKEIIETRKSKIEKFRKELSKRLFKELEEPLSKGDYVGAEASLEYRVGTTAQLKIHHNNPLTYEYATHIGLATAKTMYDLKKEIGKVPLIGNKLLTAYYSLKSEDRDIRNAALNSLFNFTLYARKKHDNWSKTIKGDKNDWVYFFRRMYSFDEKRRDEILKKYKLEKIDMNEPFKPLLELHKRLYGKV